MLWAMSPVTDGFGCLQRAREHESGLQGCALGPTGLPLRQHELLTAPQVTRLFQAVGHLCPSELFVEVVHGETPLSSGGFSYGDAWCLGAAWALLGWFWWCGRAVVLVA